MITPTTNDIKDLKSFFASNGMVSDSFLGSEIISISDAFVDDLQIIPEDYSTTPEVYFLKWKIGGVKVQRAFITLVCDVNTPAEDKADAVYFYTNLDNAPQSFYRWWGLTTQAQTLITEDEVRGFVVPGYLWAYHGGVFTMAFIATDWPGMPLGHFDSMEIKGHENIKQTVFQAKTANLGLPHQLRVWYYSI